MSSANPTVNIVLTELENDKSLLLTFCTWMCLSCSFLNRIIEPSGFIVKFGSQIAPLVSWFLLQFWNFSRNDLISTLQMLFISSCLDYIERHKKGCMFYGGWAHHVNSLANFHILYFCQLSAFMSLHKTYICSWVRRDLKIMWKQASRGVLSSHTPALSIKCATMKPSASFMGTWQLSPN